jgi:DNA-binding FadR family transcriptional regulator
VSTAGPRRLRRRFSPAEAVADELRGRILSGEVDDGALLPKLEDLTEEFGLSKAAVREAWRILEAEGLLSVQRGNVGGAVVHLPTPGNAAYTVGLVLQARNVDVPDVVEAVQRFEPLCAELCAERDDRATTVLPDLDAAQADYDACIAVHDGEGAALAARRWHESLVANCGNTTTSVLLGTLEAVWTTQTRTTAADLSGRGVRPDANLSRRTRDDHDRIRALIAAGDGPAALAAAREHLRRARIHDYGWSGEASVVQAAAIRDQLFA